MKKLSDLELSRINIDEMGLLLAQEQLKVSLLKCKNLELTIKVISHELANEKNSLESARSAEGLARTVKQNNLKTIAKKKLLKEGWGFNPDSGEIVEN
jgi:hypothetical protein